MTFCAGDFISATKLNDNSGIRYKLNQLTKAVLAYFPTFCP